MRGVNKVILVGTLGQDPDVKYAANGNVIANLSLATSDEWTDKATGQKQQKTEWHRISMFGKLAEIAGQYLKKGSQVYIEGKLQTRKWQDQNGQDRYSTEVVVSGYEGTMQMLGGGNRDNAGGGYGNQQGGGMQQNYGGGAPQSGFGQNQAMGGQQRQAPTQAPPMQQQPQTNQFNQGGNNFGGAQQQTQPMQPQQPPAFAQNDFDDDDVPF